MEPNAYTSALADVHTDTILVVGPDSGITSVIEFDLCTPSPFEFKSITDTEGVLQILESLFCFEGKEGRIAIVFNARWADENRLKLIRILNTHPQYRHIPIIVISERLHWGLGQNYLSAGADDYFNSPVSPERLQVMLEYYWVYKQEISDLHNALPKTKESPQLHYGAQRFKRLIDIAGAATALVVLSPLMILTALAIQVESRGPALYCSKRVGAGFRTFNFWKFRSMYLDADKKLDELKQQNQYGKDATFVKFANDPRITKVGRIIRKYSIDELPQLFNILWGDMSLVGNRPLPVYEADELVTAESSARFLAPAGLTGLWQVSRRGQAEMSTEERIRLDVQYSEKHDLITDFKILLRTFTAFVQKENV